MCGIFAYVGKNPEAPLLTLDALKKLEYRGYDSWGVAYGARDHFEVIKKVGKIGEAQLPPNCQSTMALGHTRWATHGGVTIENAHPHLDEQKRFAVVHNGIIENFQALKQELTHLGHVFISQTDTEVVSHLLEEKMKLTADFKTAVLQVAERLEGLNALVICDAQTKKCAAVRVGSPLVLAQAKDGWLVASDAIALADYATKVHHVRDDEVIIFDERMAHSYDLKGIKTSFNWQKLEFVAEEVDKGFYSSFLEKEIHEQPVSLRRLLAHLKEENELFGSSLKAKLFLVGCGTAYHAALFGSLIFASTGRWSQAIPASEFSNWRHLVDDDTSVIFLSQSGETIDVLEHVNWLKQHGQKVWSVVNRRGSSLERVADYCLHLQAGPEQSVLATKSFTAKLVALSETVKISPAPFWEHTFEALTTILQDSYRQHYIQPIANEVRKHSTLLVLGRGLSVPIALETALKIKEVTYIHAEGLAAGELKHGPLALVEPGTPCLIVAPPDETLPLVLSAAQELQARGAMIMILGEKSQLASYHAPLCLSKPGHYYLLLAVIGQLIAAEMATLMGRDPDKPRNLAKSVTVR